MRRNVSPLVGFNNNVKHRGQIFHVQTEDSGVSRPHILTHLFADGGRIIGSKRCDYSEHLGRPDLPDVVRQLMKEQHKAMFIALRDGRMDVAIERMCGPLPEAPKPRGAEAGQAASVTAAAGAASGEPGLDDTLQRDPLPTLSDGSSVPVGPGSAGSKLPGGGRLRTPPTGTPAVQVAAAAPSRGGGYAPSRPAAIFASSRGPGGSLFGQEAINEQSLDEVILSYLAEDLESEEE